jgi:hypothetical protein
MRRSGKVAEVLPVLYLRGLSTGDFREALAALLGALRRGAILFGPEFVYSGRRGVMREEQPWDCRES